MGRPHRILLVAVVTLVVIGVGVNWIAPVWLTIDTARKAPSNARLLPVDLPDLSVSHVRGNQLSYFGYEFEIPWDDIDGTKTKLYPNQVILTFRSGLRLMVGASPAGLWVKGFASGWKTSPKAIASSFGDEAMQSDYGFVKKLYEFTPDKMDRWALSPRVHYRDVMLLTMKSVALSPSASTGFFNIQNQSYKGFQQGSTQARPTIDVALYADDGSINFTFFQKDYQNPAGISQAEINRIVQSLHKS